MKHLIEFLIVLALTACKPTTHLGPTAATDATPRPASIEDQALAQVKAEFESKWLKQGDSWFTVEDEGIFNRHNLVQVKGVSFETSPPVMPLTEADRLNGVEWAGRVDYSATASRSKPLQGRGDWSKWVTGFQTSSLRPNTYDLKKINGKWEMEAHFGSCRPPRPAEVQGVPSP